MRILVVEDEKRIGADIAAALSTAGLVATSSPTARKHGSAATPNPMIS